MGLEKPNSGLDPGETNSDSDLDCDETFQISRNVGLDIDEIVCLLDSQLWAEGKRNDPTTEDGRPPGRLEENDPDMRDLPDDGWLFRSRPVPLSRAQSC